MLELLRIFILIIPRETLHFYISYTLLYITKFKGNLQEIHWSNCHAERLPQVYPIPKIWSVHDHGKLSKFWYS